MGQGQYSRQELLEKIVQHVVELVKLLYQADVDTLREARSIAESRIMKMFLGDYASNARPVTDIMDQVIPEDTIKKLPQPIQHLYYAYDLVLCALRHLTYKCASDVGSAGIGLIDSCPLLLHACAMFIDEAIAYLDNTIFRLEILKIGSKGYAKEIITTSKDLQQLFGIQMLRSLEEKLTVTMAELKKQLKTIDDILETLLQVLK